jgi:predicted Zn finger-like uncharacterized protein
MRIACPTCATAYEVPDALVAAGPRLLRCARCRTEFPASTPDRKAAPEPEPLAKSTQPDVPPAPDPALPEPSAAPAPKPTHGLAAVARERPSPTCGPAGPSPITPEEAPVASGQGRLAAAWIASISAIGAGIFALLHWQAEIAAAWPPAARLYTALGLS